MIAMFVFALLFIIVFIFHWFIVIVDLNTSIYVAEGLYSVNRFFMWFYGIILSVLTVVEFFVHL